MISKVVYRLKCVFNSAHMHENERSKTPEWMGYDMSCLINEYLDLDEGILQDCIGGDIHVE